MRFTAKQMTVFINGKPINCRCSIEPIIRSNTMEKDYSLLRPFDLEAARRLETICDNHAFNTYEFLGSEEHEHRKTKVAIRSISPIKGHLYVADYADLRMAPLAWVEGRPVYKGDVLWLTIGDKSSITAECFDNGMICGTCKEDGIGSDAEPIYLTWQKPKTKREGWMNCYEIGENYVYPTEGKANSQATHSRIACLRIEWEE